MHTIDCPLCHSKLLLPDEAMGKKVKCSSCKGAFVPTLPGTEEGFTVVEGGEDAVTAGPSQLTDASGGNPGTAGGGDVSPWRSVRTGLGLQLLAHFLGVGAVIFLIVLLFMEPPD